MMETGILGASLGMLAFRKEVLEYVERLVKEKFEKEKILYTVEEAAEKLNRKSFPPPTLKTRNTFSLQELLLVFTLSPI